MACATGERPPIQPCIIRWSKKYWPMPRNTLWNTREETTYFTADCALIHGYRLHPWIASCPGNGPGIRLHNAQRAMDPEAGHENDEPMQSLRPLTWVL